jgi:hypothetical protein
MAMSSSEAFGPGGPGAGLVPPPGGGGFGAPPPGGGPGSSPGGAFGGPPAGAGGPGGFGPPPGGPPGGGAPVNTTTPFVLGALSFFCCGFFCAIPLFLAWKAKQAADQGQMEEAANKAKTARNVAIGMIAVGFLLTLASVVLNVLASV